MSHVFISYSHQDSERVLIICEQLTIYGVDIWLDKNRIKPGERWEDVIRAGIQGGDFFIAFFSESYLGKGKSYINEELILAIEELRRRPFDRVWFIPVRLDECEIPDRSIGAGDTLRSLQWVDLFPFWEEGIQRILSVVSPGNDKIIKLIHDLKDPSARVRIRALDELGTLGQPSIRALRHVLAALHDENETVRAVAADSLGKIGSYSEDVVKGLIAFLRQGGLYSSRNAERSLTVLGKHSVPHLINSIDLNNKEFTDRIFWALAAIGQDASEAVPTLLNLLSQPLVDRLKESAIRALGRIGQAPEKSVPVLLDCLDSTNEKLRAAASSALGNFGHDAQVAVPRLIGFVKSDSESVSWAAILALGEIGSGSKKAVPLLLKKLRSRDFAVRWRAAEALGGIGDKSAEQGLVKALKDKDKTVRESAALALAEIGESQHLALPVLLDMIDKEYSLADIRAVKALGKMGHLAREAIPVLEKMSSHYDDDVRRAVTDAIKSIKN